MEKRNTIIKVNIDKLCSTENSIIQLGDYISELLLILKDALEGNNNFSEAIKKKLKDIFDLIEKIKSDLHELVDDIYSKKNYTYFSKLVEDYKEREKQLEEIIKFIREVIRTIDNNINKNIPYDKNPFTVNKK